MTVNNKTFRLVSLLLLVFSLTGHADVRLPKGEYYQDIDDLKVHVLGGDITVRHTWYKGRWFNNRAWDQLELKGPSDPQNTSEKLYVTEIIRNEDSYKPTFSTELNCWGSCGNPGPGAACASPPISAVLACLESHATKLRIKGSSLYL
ncbi:MAG: hypothetical protein KZQ86_10900 [Candidatus Thiodiazotropha sp. (ex Lucinoma kastoroae)]|nr:hypothetical protein [Candidatus Thiodiazotropha sp. (ex Lucinoma kastoroae)]